MIRQLKKRYQQKQQRLKVPSNRSALEEARFFREHNTELTERTRKLIDALRSAWGIDVSWDGLRRFWVIELTESGRLKRDKACKAEAENAKLRKMVSQMYEEMQGVLDHSTDTVFTGSLTTLRDCMDWHMGSMAELGIPPRDYKERMRELGIEVI